MTKIGSITLYVAVFIFLSSCSNKQISIEYVNSVNGLSLREQPSRNSKRISIIKYGDPVKIVNNNGPRETIAQKTSVWKKVRSNGNAGWVFGAFLIDNKSLAQDVTTKTSMPNRIKQYILAGSPLLKMNDLFFITGNLGEPKRIDCGKKLGPLQAVLARNCHYTYARLAIHFLLIEMTHDKKPIPGKKIALFSISINYSKYQMLYNLNVGRTKDYLLKTLGQPTNKNGVIYRYTIPNNPFRYVEFTIKNNTIKKITWIFKWT